MIVRHTTPHRPCPHPRLPPPPLPQYLWDHRAKGLQQYLVDTVVLNDQLGLGNANISGYYFDDDA